MDNFNGYNSSMVDPKTAAELFLTWKGSGGAAKEFAFEDLYRYTKVYVDRVISGYIGSKLQWVRNPSDITAFRSMTVSDTFAALAGSGEKIEDPFKLLGWLKKVALNSCCRQTGFIKSREIFPEVSEFERIVSLRYEPDPEVIFDRLTEGIGYGAPYHALRLSVLEGYEYGEISRIMDCPVGTVKSRINTARRLLRGGSGDAPEAGQRYAA